MYPRKLIGFLVFFIVLLSGCMQQSTQPVYRQKLFTVDDSKASYSDKYIDVILTPIKSKINTIPTPTISYSAYRSFELTIHNKTKSDIKLSWNDSYFLENGEAKEGFMFEGIIFSKRSEPKQDLLIFPGSKITKEIFPTVKVTYFPPDRTAIAYGMPAGWVHLVMENGEFGAYLKLNGKGYEKQVKLLTRIDVQ